MASSNVNSSDLTIQFTSENDKNAQRRRRATGHNPYYKYLLKLESSKINRLGPKLSSRAEQTTNTIIRNFLDWYNSLGGVDITIDESMLQEMFRVGFDSPIADK